jgi:tetratricopeptide (TPR) repeat protein
MSTHRPEPSLRGMLAGEPLARLLAVVLGPAPTGTLELRAPDGVESQIFFVRGELAKVRVPKPPLHLGSVIYELGYITVDQLNTSLLDVARTKQLHGALLLRRGIVSQEQLQQCLVEQTRRKIHVLFASPPETQFAFFPGFDALTGFGGDDWPNCDPRPSIWYGIREYPPVTHVTNVLTGAHGALLRLSRAADPRRFGFDDEELVVAERLRDRAMTLEELLQGSPMGRRRTELLVYCLLLTGSLEQHRARTQPPPESGRQPILSSRSIPAAPVSRPAQAAGPLSRPAPPSAPASRPASAPTSRPFSAAPPPVSSRIPGASPTTFRPTPPHAHTSGVMPKVSPRSGPAPNRASATKFCEAAYAALQAGKVDLADLLCEKAHGEDGEELSHKVLRVWIRALREEGQTEEATRQGINALSRLIEMHDESAHAHFFRGQLLKRLGRLKEAALDFKSALELDPKRLDALAELRLYVARRRRGG